MIFAVHTLDCSRHQIYIHLLGLGSRFQTHKAKLSYYEAFQRVLDDVNARAPEALGPCVQTTDFDWGWMDVERLLVETLLTGLMLCFPMSYLVLLVASGNFRIATTAIITIACIVANVMGFFQYAMGWSLDVAEVISGVMVIGLAIDYTLHIGHMLIEAKDVGIRERTHSLSRKSM